jgi:hypothetical protein
MYSFRLANSLATGGVCVGVVGAVGFEDSIVEVSRTLVENFDVAGVE